MNTENNTENNTIETNSEVKTPKPTLASAVRQVLKGIRKDRTVTVSKVKEQVTVLAKELGIEATIDYRTIFRALTAHAKKVEGTKGTFSRKDAEAVKVPAAKAKTEKKSRSRKKKETAVEDNNAQVNTEAPENTAKVNVETELQPA